MLVNARPGDGEAQGMLGRVYKDLWRVAWKDQTTLEERQSVAMENAVIAAKAIASYESALRLNLSNYYNGINVVTLQSLLDFLAEKTGALPADTDVGDLAGAYCRGECCHPPGIEESQRTRLGAPTLGELELIRGNAPEALRRYQQAANAPGATYFEIDSMLSQLRAFRRAWLSRGRGRARDQAAREETRAARRPAPYLRQGGRLQRPHDR